MKLTVEIKAENAAFTGEDLGPELARLLRKAADYFTDHNADDVTDVDTLTLMDANGNRVGAAELNPN